MAQPVQAITFDVGGTLIEPWPSVGHVYAEVAAQHGGRGLSVEDLTRRFIAAWRSRQGFDYSRLAWQRLVDQTFAGLLPRPPSTTFFEALYARFAEPGAWRIFDDVVPALAELRRRGCKLGVLSNWDDRLRPLLARLDLICFFDAVVISGEVGHLKPEAAIFQRVAADLNRPPHQILHVGDSTQEDEQGARGAGFQAVLLERSDAPARPGLIRSLSEL